MDGAHEKLSAPGGNLTQAWAIGMLDRAIGTFAVTLLSLLGAGPAGIDILHVDWKTALMTSAGATILTIIKSVAAAFVGDGGTTSLLPGGK